MSEEAPFSPFSFGPFPSTKQEEPKPNEELGPGREQNAPVPSWQQEAWKKLEGPPAEPIVFNEEDQAGPAKKIWVGVIIVALLLLAQGVWFGFPGGDETAETPGLIDAKEGGAVTASDGAQVLVPPGALYDDLALQVEKKRDGVYINQYHLSPDGLKFLQPVTVVLPYKKEIPENFSVEFGPTERGKKMPLPFTVDERAKVIRVEVMGF